MDLLEMTSDLIEKFRGIPASTVYEANDKLGDVAPNIRPLFETACMVGPAYTVKCWPGDLSAMRKAVDTAPQGSVLVIDGGGSDRTTTWGGGATIVAQRRGLAGVLTNGATRDSAQIRELGFPVFCAGSSVRGGVRHHPGWLGVPVSIGGAVVRPGDLVVADADGAVIVAAERIEQILERALERVKRDEAREQRLRQGEAYDI